MSTTTRPRAALLALLLAPLSACGEGPQKLSRAEVEAERAQRDPVAAQPLPPDHPPMGREPGLPAGHPPMGGDPGLPAGHPPMGGDPGLPSGHPPMGAGGGQEVTALSGTIELAGPLAALEAGAVFLVGYDRESGAMALVEKYDVADFERAEGRARLPFRMKQAQPTAGGGLEEIDLEVRIDLDGMVETKGDIVARTRVPARVGDEDVSVRVDESARTDAPLPSGG